MIKYEEISFEEYLQLSIKEFNENCYFINNPIDDSKYWYYKQGKIHREDGPALEYNDGTKHWWLNGNEYTFETWCKKINITDEEKVFLRLKYS